METNQNFRAALEVRSNFVRELVQRRHNEIVEPTTLSNEIPRTIVQFWDDLNHLPADVRECIQSWRKLEMFGYKLSLYNHDRAIEFIARKFGPRYEKAYQKCYHPAMQSDYFRLCYILSEGGCYVDADDFYNGYEIAHFFRDGRLKVQPLCYNFSTDQMISPSIFSVPGAYASSWLFYFGNSPLFAVSGHPIIDRALDYATIFLERTSSSELPEIQATTGPGVLTKAVFELASEYEEIEDSLVILGSWKDIATTMWPLSYRDDMRNWRLSNQREYKRKNLANAKCVD